MKTGRASSSVEKNASHGVGRVAWFPRPPLVILTMEIVEEGRGTLDVAGGGSRYTGSIETGRSTTNRFEDIDFFTFTAQPNDAIPAFGIESLFSMDSQPSSGITPIEFPSDSPVLRPPPNTIEEMDEFSSQMARTDTQDNLLHRLLDMQIRLAKLIKSLSSSPHTPEDVVEIYRASETLVRILDHIEGSDKLRSLPSSAKPVAVISQLVLNIYFSLVSDLNERKTNSPANYNIVSNLVLFFCPKRSIIVHGWVGS
jgi:hypothetical protein